MASQDPRLVQWQMRFDRALQAAQAPRQPHETDDVYTSRRAQANEALRQLQMSRPTGPAPKPTGSMGKQAAPPKDSSSSPIGALFNYIGNAMRGGN